MLTARGGRTRSLVIAIAVFSGACGTNSDRASGDTTKHDSSSGAVSSAKRDPSCVSDNGGLTLADGFCAGVFADTIGRARHIAVAPNGDLFIALEYRPATEAAGSQKGPRIQAAAVALRDANHDGRADTIVYIGKGEKGGTGIALADSFVYIDEQTKIVRYRLPSGALEPKGAAETVISGIPISGDHNARNFIIDGQGNLFLNVGSATNSCQERNRTAHSPGINPCTETTTRAGIWKFDARKTGQVFSPNARYATGIRNAEGLAIDPASGQLYSTQHGRDQLYDNWQPLFDAKYSADNPAEELMQVSQGDDFGWPYCYYAVDAKKLVLAPEYGGDGKKTAQCDQKKEPVAAFPGHWAPMDLLFYSASAFPDKYKHGVFIPFHGSWNRAPEPQAGYRVVFQPLDAGKTSGDYETFADGFAGTNPQPDQATHRPVGLGQGPNGELYITDDAHGRVWRVVHYGK
jgi:glucose/arabinose dehydrogenase